MPQNISGTDVREAYKRIIGRVLEGPLLPFEGVDVLRTHYLKGPVEGAFRATWQGEIVVRCCGAWFIFSGADESFVVHTDERDSRVSMIGSAIVKLAEQFVGADGTVEFLHRSETWNQDSFAFQEGLPEIVRRVYRSSMGYEIVFASRRHDRGNTIAITIIEGGVTLVGEQPTPDTPIHFEYLPVGSVPPF